MVSDDPQEAQARRGLEAWAAFPADRDPRPLVLLDTIPAIRPSGNFPSTSTDRAFAHRAFKAVPGFPASILEALRGQSGQYAGPLPPPLLLTDATLGSFRYETDRGERTLPTWEVRAQGVDQPIQVLDPVVMSGQVWEPPDRKRITGQRPRVALGGDGRTLIMMFTGSPFADRDQPPARILELGGAVALVFKERQRPRRSGWYTAQGVGREVTALLERPLGNRVLLDLTGAPVRVTPEHLMTGPVWARRVHRAYHRDDDTQR
jgi:hypothetical protein